MSKTIGGNVFYETLQGAKAAGTRRGVADGASIVDTKEGYCLLELGEGASQTSYSIIKGAPALNVRRNGKWAVEREDAHGGTNLNY